MTAQHIGWFVLWAFVLLQFRRMFEEPSGCVLCGAKRKDMHGRNCPERDR